MDEEEDGEGGDEEPVQPSTAVLSDFRATVAVFVAGTPGWMLPYYAVAIDLALHNDSAGGQNELGPSHWDSGEVVKHMP